MKIQQLAVEALRPHPKNPRPAPVVQELADSIKVHGFLSPLVVRDDGGGKYTILAGHRRALAAKELGLAEVPCHVLEADAAKALEVLLADNLHHEAVDPLLEAEAVEQLLKLQDWGVRDVADHLGKSVRWVAQRRELAKLSPAWRKRMGQEPWRSWPIRAWEVLVQLTSEAQDELAMNLKVDASFAVEELERCVTERTHLLGKAPFDPVDGLLVKAAGPCTSCPKTSLSAPGLFDDGEPGGDIATATCRDRKCWAEKCSAALRERVKKASSELGRDDVVVISKEHSQSADRPKGIRVLLVHQYEKAKEGDKVAVPAIALDGTGTKVSWVKPSAFQKAVNRSRSHGGSSKPAAPGRKQLEEQWKAQIDEKYADLVRKGVPAEAPRPEVVLGLVAVFGIAGIYGGKRPKPMRAAEAYTLGAELKTWTVAIWPYVVAAIADEPMGVNLSDSDFGRNPAIDQVLVDAFGLDSIALRDQAQDATPKPKALVALEEKGAKPEKQAKKKPAKKKASKKATAAAGA